MRLPEKTIELNFCSQFERLLGRSVIWFGLTQKQEAQAGFDAATRLGARLMLFQIKASNYVLTNGRRRFYAQHHQLRALQDRVSAAWRSVFYVLPEIGSTLDLARNPDLMTSSWLLDVANLPKPFPDPTVTGATRIRKSGIHYLDMDPPSLIIRSEPHEVELLQLGEFLSQRMMGSDGVEWLWDGNQESFEATRRLFSGAAVGVAIL